MTGNTAGNLVTNNFGRFAKHASSLVSTSGEFSAHSVRSSSRYRDSFPGFPAFFHGFVDPFHGFPVGFDASMDSFNGSVGGFDGFVDTLHGFLGSFDGAMDASHGFLDHANGSVATVHGSVATANGFQNGFLVSVESFLEPQKSFREPKTGLKRLKNFKNTAFWPASWFGWSKINTQPRTKKDQNK